MMENLPVDNGKSPRVLMKSKHRVQKHGEVFTPQWVIDKMMSIPGIREKTEDLFATFLEPSAGEGAFLLAIEEMKLQYIADNYGKNEWDRHALWALTSIYGIELLEDNLTAARQNMLRLFLNHRKTVHNAGVSESSDMYKSARTIIWANVVQGDALTHKNLLGEYITFSHWKQVPGTWTRVQRIPFTYSSLLTGDREKNKGVQQRMFEEKEKQLSILKMIKGGDEGVSQPQRYAIVDIDQVWREEKEDDS